MKALLVDIGNSRVKARVIDTVSTRSHDLEPVALDRLDRIADLWRLDDAALQAVDTALISNVAGEASTTIIRWLEETSPAVDVAFVVAKPVEASVINGYRDPSRLGSDRWMALIGAHAAFPDRSLLVCSFGTATTIDLLRRDADRGATFVGGLIVPGVDAMRAALVGRTVQLDVAAGSVVAFADDTGDAIASGVMAAQLGAVREAWRQARARTIGRLDLVVAGGASQVVVDALGDDTMETHHVPDLVLRGLAVVARGPAPAPVSSDRPALAPLNDARHST